MGNATNTATDLIHDNGLTFVEAKPVTRSHYVLIELGHRVAHQVMKDGTLCPAYHIIANPNRKDKYGDILEEDYQRCDEAEEAPLYGPVRRPVYTRVWVDEYDRTEPGWMDHTTSRGHWKSEFSRWE